MMSHSAPTIIPLADQAKGAPDSRRLDWHLINRVARTEIVQRYLAAGTRGVLPPGDVGFDLSGFRFLNLDALANLLSMSEALSRGGIPPIVLMPTSVEQQLALVNNGFARAARRVCRLQ